MDDKTLIDAIVTFAEDNKILPGSVFGHNLAAALEGFGADKRVTAAKDAAIAARKNSGGNINAIKKEVEDVLKKEVAMNRKRLAGLLRGKVTSRELPIPFTPDEWEAAKKAIRESSKAAAQGFDFDGEVLKRLLFAASDEEIIKRCAGDAALKCADQAADYNDWVKLLGFALMQSTSNGA
jgi:restriction endonuclease Mrr